MLRSYLCHFHFNVALNFFFNLAAVHSPHFLSIFLSYSSFTLSLATVSPLGHVAQLQLRHCALIFSISKQICWNLLLYLCHHDKFSHEHHLLQLIQYPLPSASVSLNLAFSCANSIANCNGFILGHSVLYSLLGFHSTSLISFSIFLLYCSSFFFNSAFFFLSYFSNSCCHPIFILSFLFSINIKYFKSILFLRDSILYNHFFSTLSLVFKSKNP